MKLGCIGPLAGLSILLAALALLSAPALAWDTPDAGADYTLADLVAISGGAVTGSGEAFRVHENVSVSLTDSLAVAAGASIEFDPGTGLEVLGAVSVEGSRASPVAMTSSGGRWDGITLRQLSEATLRHLLISRADTSVLVDAARGAVLEDVTLDNVTEGVVMEGCGDVRLLNLTATDVTRRAVGINGSETVRVLGCYVEGAYVAVKCQEGSRDVEVRDLETVDCRDSIDLDYVDHCVLENITVHHNEWGGIYLYAVTNFTISRVNISSRWSGISIGGYEVESSGTMGTIRMGDGHITIGRSKVSVDDIVLREASGYAARFRIGRSIVDIENLSVMGMGKGLILDSSAEVLVRNSTITNSVSRDISVTEGATLQLINVSFGSYEVENPNSRLVVSQVLEVTVLDAWGDPMGGVDVSVEGVEDDLSLSAATAADGRAVFTPLRILEVTEGTSTGIAGSMDVLASVGWLSNGARVPVNRSNLLTLALADVTPPVPSVEVPGEADAGTTARLTAADSTDDDPSFPSTGDCTWEVRGPDGNATLHGLEADLELAAPGAYYVDWTVRDRHGNAASGSATLIALDVTPPVAVAENLTVPQGEEAVLDASASYDPNTDLSGSASVRWTLDVGGSEVRLGGWVARHAFDSPGNHSCLLEVLDAAGNVGSATFWVRVLDTTPPVADAGPDVEALVGDRVALDGGNSSDGTGVSAYAWTVWSEPPVELEGEVVEHVFGEAGSFRVTLEVEDLEGNTAVDEAWVNVTARQVSLEVTQPANGSRVGAAFVVTGNVTTDLPTATLRHRVTNGTGVVRDWQEVEVAGAFSVPVNLSGLGAGGYAVELVVDDGYTAHGPVEWLVVYEPGGGGDGNGGDDGSPYLLPAVVVVVIVIALVAMVLYARRRG